MKHKNIGLFPVLKNSGKKGSVYIIKRKAIDQIKARWFLQ